MEKDKDTKTDATQPNKIEVDGKEFDSVDDLKKAYSEAQKVIGRQGQKMGEMKKSLLKGVAKDSTDYSKMEEDLFDKPVEVLQKLTQNITQSVKESIAEEENQKDVWNQFFTKHKVPAAMQSKIKNDAMTNLWPSLEGKTQDEQFETIAKEWSPFLSLSATSDKEDEDSGYEDTDLDSARGGSTTSNTKSSKETLDKPLDFVGMINKRFS